MHIAISLSNTQIKFTCHKKLQLLKYQHNIATYNKADIITFAFMESTIIGEENVTKVTFPVRN